MTDQPPPPSGPTPPGGGQQPPWPGGQQPPPSGAQPPPPGGYQPPPAGAQPPPPGGYQAPGAQPPPPGGWQQPAPGTWQQPPQQVVVKDNSGCWKAVIVALIVLALIGAGVVGCVAFTGKAVVDSINRATGIADQNHYEVTDVDCDAGDEFSLKATGKITNTSGESQAFKVTVRWVDDSGVLIANSVDYTDEIADGQSQFWEARSFDDPPEGASPTCEIAKVEYTIFGN